MNKKPLLAFMILAVLTSLVSGLSVLVAEGDSRIMVVPDDYSTIMDAITNASDGDTIFVRNGTYLGPANETIEIGKTLAIVGENAEGTVIMLYPSYRIDWILTTPFYLISEAITVTADNFRLLNLTIIIGNAGGSISVAGNGTQIVGNNITQGRSTGLNITGSNCKVTDNKMDGSIRVNGTNCEISRNTQSADDYYGIFVRGSSNTIENNNCEFLGIGTSTNTTVSGNRGLISERRSCSIKLDNSTNNLVLRNEIASLNLWRSSENLIAANNITSETLSSIIDLGGNSSNNKIYLNNFVHNTSKKFSHASADRPNCWDNSTIGNYWNNYNASDADNNGILDSPYMINQDNRDNFPLANAVDIGNVSIEMPVWENPSANPSPSANAPSPSATQQPEPEQTETSPSPTLNPSPSIPEVPTWLIALPIAASTLLFAYAKKRLKH